MISVSHYPHLMAGAEKILTFTPASTEVQFQNQTDI